MAGVEVKLPLRVTVERDVASINIHGLVKGQVVSMSDSMARSLSAALITTAAIDGSLWFSVQGEK